MNTNKAEVETASNDDENLNDEIDESENLNVDLDFQELEGVGHVGLETDMLFFHDQIDEAIFDKLYSLTNDFESIEDFF